LPGRAADDGSACQRPCAAQVAGLNDTFHVVVVLMALALLLATWAWYRRRARSLGIPQSVGEFENR
jgi:hypothetical protein